MLDIPTFFKGFPQEPDEASASNAIARLIDGLGYRLYWALDGLREQDCQYTLCEGAPSIKDILWHSLGLVNWVYMHVYGHQMTRKPSIIDQGIGTLVLVVLGLFKIGALVFRYDFLASRTMASLGHGARPTQTTATSQPWGVFPL